MFEIEDLFDLTIEGAFPNKEEFIQFASNASDEDLYSVLQEGAFIDVDEFVSLKKKDETEDLVSTTEEVTTTVDSEEVPMPQPSASLDSGDPLPEGFEFPTTVTPGIMPPQGKFAKDVELDADAITKEEKLSDIVRTTRFEDPITGTLFETGIPETYPETHNIYKRALQKAENDLLNQVLDEDEDMFSREGERFDLTGDSEKTLSNLYRQKRNKEFEIQQVQNRIDIIPEGSKDLEIYQLKKDSLTNELDSINKTFDESSKKRAKKDDTGQIYNPYTGEDIAKIDAPTEIVQSEQNVTTESNNLAKTKTNEQLEKSLIDIRFQLLNQGKRVSGQMQDVLDGMISTELMFFGGPTEEGFTNLPQAEDEILRKKPLKIYSEHPEAIRYNRLIDQYHALDRALRLNVDPTQIKTSSGSIVDFGLDSDFDYGLTSAIFGEQPARLVTPTTKMKATDFIEGLESAGFVNIPDKTKERIEKTFTEEALQFGGELTGMVAELALTRRGLTAARLLGKGRTAVKLKKGLEALGASTKNKYVKGGLKILGSGIDEAAVFAITGELTRKPDAYDPVFGAALGVGGEVANLGSKFISKLPIVKNISNKIKQLPFYNVGSVAGQSVAGATAGTSVLYAAEIVDALITEDKDFAEIVKQVAGDDPEQKAMLLFTTMLAGNIAKSFPQFSKALRKDISELPGKRFASKVRDYVNKTKPVEPTEKGVKPEAPLELQESIVEVNKNGTPEQKQEAQDFLDGVETLQSVAEVKSLAESIENKELKELEQVELVNNISNQIVENPKITTTELALSQPEIKSIITSSEAGLKSLHNKIKKQFEDGVISAEEAKLARNSIQEVINIKKTRFATITNVDKQAEGIGIELDLIRVKKQISDLESQILTADGTEKLLDPKKSELESLEKQLDDFKNFREEPTVEVTEEVVAEEVVTPEVTDEILVEGKLEVDNLTEGSTSTTKPIKIYKGIGGKKDLKGFRINAHEGAEGVFSAVDKSLAEEYGKEEGVAEVVLPEGTTVEVVEIDGKGMTLDEYRAAEVEAINNSDAQVVKLRTVDGVMKKGAKKQDQYIIKDETLIQELKKPEEVESVEEEVVEVIKKLSPEQQEKEKKILIKDIEKTITDVVTPKVKKGRVRVKLSPKAQTKIYEVAATIKGLDLNSMSYDQVKSLSDNLLKIEEQGKAEKKLADKAKRIVTVKRKGKVSEGLYKEGPVKQESKELKSQVEVKDFLSEGVSGNRIVIIEGNLISSPGSLSQFIKDNPDIPIQGEGYETLTMTRAKRNQPIESKLKRTGRFLFDPTKSVANVRTQLMRVGKGSPELKKYTNELLDDITQDNPLEVEEKTNELMTQYEKALTDPFRSKKEANKYLDEKVPGMYKDSKKELSNGAIVDLEIERIIHKQRADRLREDAKSVTSKSKKQKMLSNADKMDNILELSDIDTKAFTEYVNKNPKVKKVVKSFIDFYNNNTDRFRPLIEDVTGRPPMTETYYPTYRNDPTIDKKNYSQLEIDQITDEPNFYNASAMTDRLKFKDPNSTSALKPSDVREKAQDYIQTMIHAEVYIPTSRKVNELFNPSTRGKIYEKIGPTNFKYLQENLDYIIDPKRTNSYDQALDIATKFNRLGITFQLGFSLGNITKQITSFSHYAAVGGKDGITPFDWANAFRESVTNKEYRKVAMDIITSKFVRDRLRKSNIDPDLKIQGDEALKSGGQKAWDWYQKVAMSPITAGDIGGVILGGVPFSVAKYKKIKTTPEGVFDKKAYREAYKRFRTESNEAQQSSAEYTMSSAQRNKAMKLLLTYRTAQTQAFNKSMQGWIDMRDKSNTDKERWDGFKRWSYFSTSGTLFQAVANGGLFLLFNTLTGGEKDKKDKTSEQVIYDSLTGGLESYTQGMGGVGYFPQVLTNLAKGRPPAWNLPPSVVKAFQFGNVGYRIVEMLLENKSWDDLKDKEKKDFILFINKQNKIYESIKQGEPGYIIDMLLNRSKNYGDPSFDALFKGKEFKLKEYITIPVKSKEKGFEDLMKDLKKSDKKSYDKTIVDFEVEEYETVD